jgi:hypothetical protein
MSTEYIASFDLPIRFTANCEVEVSTNEKTLYDNIKTTLFVRENGFPLMPLGVGMEELVFEPMDAGLRAVSSYRIVQGINTAVEGVLAEDNVQFQENENELIITVPYYNTKLSKHQDSVLKVPMVATDINL